MNAHRSSSWFLLLGALLASAPGDAAARRYGSLEFEPCSLVAEAFPLAVEAQCTTFEVPEDRAKPNGRKLKLAIGWVPARASEAAKDPVFMLAGGPGQGARKSYPTVSPAFSQVLRTRDLILVDQRGTGDSHPLACRDESGSNAFGDLADQSVEAQRVFVERCLAQLDADPRHYTTEDAVADLEAVRAALGAEQISLVGISYGTRVAQTYLRRHPERVRAVVLDGVVPPALALGSEHARNLEDALELHFAQCAKTPACSKAFGSPRANLDALLARLRAEPARVRYRDASTGELREERFGAMELAAVVRLYAYAPQTAAMLPMALAEAAQGRYELLAAQARMLTSVLGEDIMHGMQLSVICTEDVDRIEADPDDATRTLGDALIALTRAQCAAWPRGVRRDDFTAPLRTDAPVLLLSGEFDPVTPPRYGEQVVASLPKGRHLVARGTGHNVLPAGCMPKLLAEFLKDADAKALDARCLDDLRYVPPFAGYYGWEP